MNVRHPMCKQTLVCSKVARWEVREHSAHEALRAVASESESFLPTVYDADSSWITDQANKQTRKGETNFKLEVWPFIQRGQACSSSREVEINHAIRIVRRDKQKQRQPGQMDTRPKASKLQTLWKKLWFQKLTVKSWLKTSCKEFIINF